MKKLILSFVIIVMLFALFSIPAVAADGEFMRLEKTGVWNDADGDGVASAGDTVNYTYKVSNIGGFNLTGVTVTDPSVTISGGASTLAPDENTTFSGTYTLTQADVDAGSVESTATAKARAIDVATGEVTHVILNTANGDESTVEESTGSSDNHGLILEKTLYAVTGSVGQKTFGVGSLLSYKFTLQNSGNLIIAKVNISDEILTYREEIEVSLAHGESKIIIPDLSYCADMNVYNYGIENTCTVSYTCDQIVEATGSLKITLPKYNISIVPAPASIVGNGTSISLLTATVTNTANGAGIPGVTVEFSTSEYNDDDNFFSDEACMTACRTAVTDEDGVAKLYYRSTNLESESADPTIFSPVSFDINATAEDTARDLYATDSFEITFTPGTLAGVLYDDTSDSYLSNKEITISLNNEENSRVWSATLTTDENGAYSTYVPWSGETYTISYEKTIETVDSVGNTVEIDMTYSQKGTTDDGAVGEGGTYDSENTITGIVWKQNAATDSTMLLDETEIANYKVSIYSGTDVSEGDSAEATADLEENGQFAVEGLDIGTYTVVVTYEIDGQTLIAETKTVTIDSDGQMTISEVLIDPYGTITNKNTGDPINDVTVTLYYADTARNIGNGITPDTVVSLPSVSGFEPNDNVNPDTDADGEYAFMVFPTTDYYITATADGYKTYVSSTLSVAYTALKHDIKMTKKTSGGSGDVTKYYTLSFQVNGGNKIDSVRRKSGTVIDLDNYTTTRDGYTFEGWYSDSELTDQVTSVKLMENKVVYAGWIESSEPETSEPEISEPEISEPESNEPENPDYGDELNLENHFAYVLGYADGTVQPEGNITRAEAATMIYRLLTASRRDEVFTSSNDFSDVSAEIWYNKAVSSMANGSYILGYDDGSFKGNDAITRAEFVAILVRFIGVDDTATASFSDVSTDHWAYAYIATAVNAEWINGYSDGTFLPDQYITRAEAMTIINRILNRGISSVSSIPDGIIEWPDNASDAWYYYEVIEATNDHEYTGTRPNEDWTSLTIDYSYDIDKYERP